MSPSTPTETSPASRRARAAKTRSAACFAKRDWSKGGWESRRGWNPVLPRRLFFGGRQVADDHVLLDLVDDQLIRLLRLAGVKLDRLVGVLVFLLVELVVRHHVDAVLVALGIDLLQVQGDIADALRLLGLAEFELEVVPFAEPPQRLQFLRVGGNQAALHSEIALGGLQVGDGLLQLR